MTHRVIPRVRARLRRRRPTAPVAVVETGSGLRLIVRPLRPDDRERLRAAFDALSPESRYRRFFAPIEELPDEQLEGFTRLDYVDHFAWGALDADHPEHVGVGVARYVRLAGEPDAAELAVTVSDAYQGRGAGSLLTRLLALTALRNGFRRLCGILLEDNAPMKRVLTELGAEFRVDAPGVLAFEIDLPAWAASLPATPATVALRALADVAAPRTAAVPPLAPAGT